jgi:hypothetical protein
MRPVTYSWLVVVVAVACAAIGWLGIAGWLAVAVAAASVGMHVAGNAIGTRLREATDSDLRRLRLRGDARRPALPQQTPSLLERRSDMGRLVRVSAGIGAACGGLAGAAALHLLAASSPAGAVLGGLSSAVIGAIVGFLGASFVEIVRTSLREAIAAERGR